MIMTITIVTFLASFFPLFTMRKAFVCAVPNQVGSDMSKWRASKYEQHRSHPSLETAHISLATGNKDDIQLQRPYYPRVEQCQWHIPPTLRLEM